MNLPLRLALVLALSLGFTGNASALPSSPIVRDGSAFQLIDAAQRAGVLTAHEARMQTFYGLFYPERLDEAYRDAHQDDAPPCATGLLAEIRANWVDLDSSERHLVELATSPIYRQWLSNGGITWEEGDVFAAQDAERATCFSPSQVYSQGGPYNHISNSDNFSVHYNLDSDVSHDKVDDLLGWLEESYEIEHEEMGFYLPNGMLSNEMLVMIERLPSESTGGFTSYAQCGFSGYMAFVVINSQWFDSSESMKSVAAHEFFHGVQIEYAAAEMWANPNTPNRWWVEASAVYMETEVYPTLYNSQFSQAFRWITEPYRSLQSYDNSGYQYGTYVFAASVREGLDNTEWFKEIWLQIYERSGYDLIEEFDELFAEYDSSFEEQWGRFLEVAATGEYEFNEYLPGPGGVEEATNGWRPNSTTAEHEYDEYPVSEAVNSSSGLDRPEYLGVNYVHLEGEGLDDDLGLIIRFDGAGEKNGEDLSWEVRLIAHRNNNSKLTHKMQLSPVIDEDGAIEKWVGETLLNDFGEDFDGVYIAASPTSDFGSGGVTWGYEAELTDSRADGSFQDEWEDDSGDDDDDDNNVQGCACEATGPANSTAGSPAALALLLGLLGVRRMRRG